MSEGLVLMVFPQEWKDGGVDLRILLLPQGDPLAPLVAAPVAPPSIPFADANLHLDLYAVVGKENAPRRDLAVNRGTAAPEPALRRPWFELLTQEFTIDAAADQNRFKMDPAVSRIRKYLPMSYRRASGYTGAHNPFTDDGSAFACAVEKASSVVPPPRPAPKRDVSWGQVLQFALRQPLLAEKLGLLFYGHIDLDDDDLLRNGGWLFADLGTGNSYSAEAAAQPGLVSLYAARIPELTEERQLFCPVAFRVIAGPPAPAYDPAAVSEAALWDDGFARLVHANQPLTAHPRETAQNIPPSAKDAGIQLGWDDEQIAIWQNRHLVADPAAPNHAPVTVAGYRVDVQSELEDGTFTPWKPLGKVAGDLELQGTPLGHFDHELPVEVLPVQLEGKRDGEYWLPAFFVAWAGGSLVLTDPLELEITRRTEKLASRQLAPVEPVELRYGTNYQFRVRLQDISGGGPKPEREPLRRVSLAKVSFRRHLPPRAVSIILEAGEVVEESQTRYKIARPRLGYPEAVFTHLGDARQRLKDDFASIAMDGTGNEVDPGREISIPDPDVRWLEIRVDVKSTGGDDTPDGYVTLYSTLRPFPADLDAPVELELNFEAVADITSITAANPFDANEEAGPLPVPKGRGMRFSLWALGDEDDELGYWGSLSARRSVAPLYIFSRSEPSAEEGVLVEPAAPALPFQGFFLQPAFPGIEEVARHLGLSWRDLTLFGRTGRRVILGCNATLPHTLAPDASSLQFSDRKGLIQRWIVPLHMVLQRDWTWNALQTVTVKRQHLSADGNVVAEVVTGTFPLPTGIPRTALTKPQRGQSDWYVLDSFDPKPPEGEQPEEMLIRYQWTLTFRGLGAEHERVVQTPTLRLPVTTPPALVPRLVSAGIAATKYRAAGDYSSSEPGKKALWLEFERPLEDAERDDMFGRVLAIAPDPVLLRPEMQIPRREDAPFDIDQELIRRIVPEQDTDDSGLEAMQPLSRSTTSLRHYLLPLPPGFAEDAPELFGFFVYEFRAGHNAKRWCTAQGRFGPPLRVSGVQHPAPPLQCIVRLTLTHIEAGAAVAAAVFEGANLRPRVPLAAGFGVDAPPTQIWILVYTQVAQMDGASSRNVMLHRALASLPQDPPEFAQYAQNFTEYAIARISLDMLGQRLRDLGLAGSAPLSVLAVEMLPAPEIRLESKVPPLAISSRYRDPLGRDLGQVRILRTSPLVQVPPRCD